MIIIFTYNLGKYRLQIDRLYLNFSIATTRPYLCLSVFAQYLYDVIDRTTRFYFLGLMQPLTASVFDYCYHYDNSEYIVAWLFILNAIIDYLDS